MVKVFWLQALIWDLRQIWHEFRDHCPRKCPRCGEPRAKVKGGFQYGAFQETGEDGTWYCEMCKDWTVRAGS